MDCLRLPVPLCLVGFCPQHFDDCAPFSTGNGLQEPLAPPVRTFENVPCAPIPKTMPSSLPQNSWAKVPGLSLGWQDSPTQGNAGSYLVLQLANQLGQPVDLPFQPLCLGVRGTCTEPEAVME